MLKALFACSVKFTNDVPNNIEFNVIEYNHTITN